MRRKDGVASCLPGMCPEAEDAVEGRRGTLSARAASSCPGGGSAIAIGEAAALEIQCKLKQN